MSNVDVSAVKRFKQFVGGELEKRFTHSSDCLPLQCAAVDPRYSHLRFLADGLREEICEELEDEIGSLGTDLTDKVKEPPAKKGKCYVFSTRAWL